MAKMRLIIQSCKSGCRVNRHTRSSDHRLFIPGCKSPSSSSSLAEYYGVNSFPHMSSRSHCLRSFVVVFTSPCLVEAYEVFHFGCVCVGGEGGRGGGAYPP